MGFGDLEVGSLGYDLVIRVKPPGMELVLALLFFKKAKFFLSFF